MPETMAEAHRFLGLPDAIDGPRPLKPPSRPPPVEAARRLWSIGKPIDGTLAGRYLARRGVVVRRSSDALRYHADCFRPDLPANKRPALLAKISARDGTFQGVHRTWLDPATADKASIDVPRKTMGRLRGNGVWIGAPADLVAAGEGLETVLSLRAAMPSFSVVAALSAGNVAALILPPGLRRLYVAADDDHAGRWATESLLQRARAEGIDAAALVFPGGDANDALQRQGIEEFRASLRSQLSPEDVDRLLG